MSFSAFATPLSHLMYTTDYFNSLKLSELPNMLYPYLAPTGSVLSTEFSKNTLYSAAATLVKPGECLPHFSDLRAVTSVMEDAFKDGMRSVKIQFMHQGARYSVHYCFTKIALIRNISNYFTPIQECRHLLTHIQSPDFQSLGLAVDAFCNAPFLSRINGFHVTDFPLYKLCCLLGEKWLHEDVFNALAELSYFRCAYQERTLTLQSITPSDCIILPTTFLLDACQAYPSQEYTKEILALHQRIQKTNPRVIAMGMVQDNHFLSFIYRPGSDTVEYGDSMHRAPPSNILPVIQWVFSSLIEHPINKMKPGLIAKQGFGNGEGSCGIIALNFIDLAVGSYPEGIRRWNGQDSRLFRDAALCDLIRYHYIAGQTFGNFKTWTVCLLDMADCDSEFNESEFTAADNIVAGTSGYNDFNSYALLESRHPIFEFCDSVATNPGIYSKLKPVKKTIVPTIDQLCSNELKPLLPPFILATVTTPHCNGRKHRRQPSPSPIPDVKSLMDDFIDLCSPSTKRKRRSHHIEYIDLSRSPSSKLKRPKLSSKSGASINNPTTPVKQESVASVIDLCTPPHGPQLKPAVSAKCEKPDIDLCTPKKEKTATTVPPSSSLPHSHTRRPPTEVAHGVVSVGAAFHSLEDAESAVKIREERLGHVWRRGQSKPDNWGNRKKLTLRCNHYYHHTPVHSKHIHPADHRQGKSIKTSCGAHVNINRHEDGKWRITLVDWEHNHPPEIPKGAPIKHSITTEQREKITQLANSSTQTFSRGQIAEILKTQSADHPVPEPRQITNIINKARRDAHKEVERLGGDMNAIIASLRQKMQEEQGWQFEIKVDESLVVTGLWWQSPQQVDLCRRYGDVLINDNTYNRNRTGYPLNIGLGIDGHGSSRNFWYAFHAIEDESHHSWVLRCHLKSAGYHPEVFISDRSRSLIAAVTSILPLTSHFFCIHHLDGNVDKNLSRLIPSTNWAEFKNSFWDVYRAVSPEHFEQKWNTLITHFPQAEAYLNDELYSCREQWAWAFTSFQYTCGVRTNGRVEVENRVNKAIGGPKKSLLQLFNGLNDRTVGQSAQELIRVRDSSRRQHPSNIQTIFPGPLAIIEQFVGPFGFQTCFKQMELSVYYSVKPLSLPDGMHEWNEYALAVSPLVGYEWEGGEETRMLNGFSNDRAHVSTHWLLRLVKGRGLRVESLFCVTHVGTEAYHMLGLLQNGNYICDCCMGLNLGLPCRHFFRVLSEKKDLKFNIGVIRARWYQDKDLITDNIPLVPAREAQIRQLDAEVLAPQETKHISANPLEMRHSIPFNVSANPLETQCTPLNVSPGCPPTETIPARTVFHEAHAALTPLTNGIQTREQLQELLEDLNELRTSRQQEAEEGLIREPPVLNPKGRPRHQRMTGALEGRPRGGGAGRTSRRRTGGNKCGACRQKGHSRPNCPYVPPTLEP